MPAFYFEGEQHTLASALRPALEEAHPDAFVACTLVHPLDAHLTVDAPSEAAVRTALLQVKAWVAAARADTAASPRAAAAAR